MGQSMMRERDLRSRTLEYQVEYGVCQQQLGRHTNAVVQEKQHIRLLRNNAGNSTETSTEVGHAFSQLRIGDLWRTR